MNGDDDERAFFPERLVQSPAKAVAADKPHYLGHRDRLRERFAAGPNTLPTTNCSSFYCFG